MEPHGQEIQFAVSYNPHGTVNHVHLEHTHTHVHILILVLLSL